MKELHGGDMLFENYYYCYKTYYINSKRNDYFINDNKHI